VTDERGMDEDSFPESIEQAREALLVELVQAQRGDRRQRRSRRALLSFSLLSCVLLAALAWTVTGGPLREGSPARPLSPPAMANANAGTSGIEIVTTPDRPLEVEYLTEAELLDTLLAEGFDLGVAKTEGQILVVWR